jgi:hypothetical protein
MFLQTPFLHCPTPEKLKNVISTYDRRRLVLVDDDNNGGYVRSLCATEYVFFKNHDSVEGFDVCPEKLVSECNLGKTGDSLNIRKKLFPKEHRAHNHY